MSPNAELERWILGWGDQMEVLRPPTLREKIAARLQRASSAPPPATPSRCPRPPRSPPSLRPRRRWPPAGPNSPRLPPRPRLPPLHQKRSSPIPVPMAPGRLPRKVLTRSPPTPREDLPRFSRAPSRLLARTLQGPHDHPRDSSRAPSKVLVRTRQVLVSTPKVLTRTSQVLVRTFRGSHDHLGTAREHPERFS